NRALRLPRGLSHTWDSDGASGADRKEAQSRSSKEWRRRVGRATRAGQGRDRLRDAPRPKVRHRSPPSRAAAPSRYRPALPGPPVPWPSQDRPPSRTDLGRAKSEWRDEKRIWAPRIYGAGWLSDDDVDGESCSASSCSSAGEAAEATFRGVSCANTVNRFCSIESSRNCVAGSVRSRNGFGAKPSTNIRTASGAISAISRKLMSAIVRFSSSVRQP